MRLQRIASYCSRHFREQGWTGITARDYRSVWQRYGGSVITHPDIVAKLSRLVEIDVRYLGWFRGDELVAGLPVWGRHIALSRQALKEHGQKRAFDLGNAEIILPQADDAPIRVRHRMRYVSGLHQGRVPSLRRLDRELALARRPEEYRKKFRYNQRREWRKLEEYGGKVHPMAELSSAEQAALYVELFEKRWGFDAPAKARLPQVLTLLRPHLTGHFITVDGRPAAIQILYRVESPAWVSVEYVNGGVEPALQAFSPGSVLSFVNTQREWQYARDRNKELRYSFGVADREYKSRWCNAVPAFEV